jgi:hypothetical protein
MLKPCRDKKIMIINPIEKYKSMSKHDNWHFQKNDANLQVMGRIIADGVRLLQYDFLLQQTFDQFLIAFGGVDRELSGRKRDENQVASGIELFNFLKIVP